MVFLEISGVSKAYDRKLILDNINLRIDEGEFISVFGPNGCGKTTFLNTISGLDPEYTGVVRFDTDSINQGYIFQNVNHSLLPWKNVIENLTLESKKEYSRPSKKLLQSLNLWESRDKYPYQLSGGMKQLLAIARAFVHECNFLLLDEPFSSLDYNTALSMRKKLMGLWELSSPTILFVSHDIDETIFLSDRIILLSKGPARIRSIIKVNLPRPRDESILSSEDFNRYRKILLEHIKNENR